MFAPDVPAWPGPRRHRAPNVKSECAAGLPYVPRSDRVRLPGTEIRDQRSIGEAARGRALSRISPRWGASVLDDEPRSKGLVNGVRVGMDDRRRQPLEPLELHAGGDPARVSRPVGRHERCEKARRRRRPLTVPQPTRVGSTVWITAKRALQEFDRDREHQSFGSGQVERIALARASPGRSIIGG